MRWAFKPNQVYDKILTFSHGTMFDECISYNSYVNFFIGQENATGISVFSLARKNDAPIVKDGCENPSSSSSVDDFPEDLFTGV